MPAPSSRLTITEVPNGIAVAGEFDAHTAPEVAAHLDPLPAGTGAVVIDAAEVSFVDSSGLRVLIDAARRADEAGRSIVVRNPSPAVNRLLELSGLADVFHVESAP